MLGLQPQVFLGLPLKRGAGSLGALVLGWGGGSHGGVDRGGVST